MLACYRYSRSPFVELKSRRLSHMSHMLGDAWAFIPNTIHPLSAVKHFTHDQPSTTSHHPKTNAALILQQPCRSIAALSSSSLSHHRLNTMFSSTQPQSAPRRSLAATALRGAGLTDGDAKMGEDRPQAGSSGSSSAHARSKDRLRQRVYERPQFLEKDKAGKTLQPVNNEPSDLPS